MTDFVAKYMASNYGLCYAMLDVRPDRTHLAALKSAPQSMSGLYIASITVMSPTQLRVIFNCPALDTPALRAVVNYSISPSLTIYSVTPEAVVSPTYVDLLVDEQKTGVTYTLTMYTGEPAP